MHMHTLSQPPDRDRRLNVAHRCCLRRQPMTRPLDARTPRPRRLAFDPKINIPRFADAFGSGPENTRNGDLSVLRHAVRA